MITGRLAGKEERHMKSDTPISMKLGWGILIAMACLVLLGYGLGDRAPDRGDIFLLTAVACGCAGSIYNGATTTIKKLQARIQELESAR